MKKIIAISILIILIGFNAHAGWFKASWQKVDGVKTVNGDLTVTGTLTASDVDINSGTIDGVDIGLTTPATAAFTTLSTTGASIFQNTVTLDDGTTDSPALILKDGTDETYSCIKKDAGYVECTSAAGDGLKILTGNLVVGDACTAITIDGEDFCVDGDAGVDGALTVTGTTTLSDAVTITVTNEKGIDLDSTITGNDGGDHGFDQNLDINSSSALDGNAKAGQFMLHYLPFYNAPTETKNLNVLSVDSITECARRTTGENDTRIDEGVRGIVITPTTRNWAEIFGTDDGVPLLIDEYVGIKHNPISMVAEGDGAGAPATNVITNSYGLNFDLSITTDCATDASCSITNGTGMQIGGLDDADYGNTYGIVLLEGESCVWMDDRIGTALCSETVTLTASEINNSRGTPIELIAARGADTWIEFKSLTIVHNWGADFTVGADEDLIIRYDGGAGSDLTASIETDGLLDNVGADTVFLIPALTSNVDVTAAINKKVEVFNTGTGEIADGSGSTVDFKITYLLQVLNL